MGRGQYEKLPGMVTIAKETPPSSRDVPRDDLPPSYFPPFPSGHLSSIEMLSPSFLFSHDIEPSNPNLSGLSLPPPISPKKDNRQLFDFIIIQMAVFWFLWEGAFPSSHNLTRLTNRLVQFCRGNEPLLTRNHTCHLDG